MNCRSAIDTGIVDAIQDFCSERRVSLSLPTTPTADRIAVSFRNESGAEPLYYSALRSDMSTYVSEMVPTEHKQEVANVISKLITLAELWGVQPRV